MRDINPKFEDLTRKSTDEVNWKYIKTSKIE